MRPLIVSALALSLAACSKPDAAPSDAAAADTARAPAAVAAADFQKIRWLEGRWRGTEGGGDPFFEAYSWVDDSTMRSFTFRDSTFAQAGDSGTIALRGGRITSAGSDSRYVVTELEDSSVRFDPLENAHNAFTWTRVTPDSWTAKLEWRGNEGKRQERTYQMTRVGN